MENLFCRVRSAKDILISVSLVVLGLVLTFFPNEVGANIGGFFILLIGLLFMFLFKSAYKKNGTNELYVKKELFFAQEMNNTILKAVLDNPKSIDMSMEGKGKTIKLSIYYSLGSGKAYMQLYEYVPYMYEPQTDVLEWDVNSVANLIK